MSMAILKSPTLIDQRLNLGGEARAGGTAPASAASAVDPRAAIEAEVRAELKAQYEAQLEEAKTALKEEAEAEGYKAGLATGHEDGMASALAAFQKKQALLEKVLEEVEAQREAWVQSVCSQATDLAKEAIGHFIGEHALNPAVLQGIIKQVSAGLREADVLGVRLHPTECQILRTALKQGAMPAGSHSRMADKLIDDASLQAGGVVIDTPRGEYRATLDVQLKKLLNWLDEQRAAGPATPVYHALRA